MSQHRKPERKNETLPLAGVVEDTRARAASSNDLDRLGYILEEIRDGYVFLSKPANFNDPYDSALSISWEHALKQAMEQILPEYGYDPKSVEFFISLPITASSIG
jgi:hypothetical protein